MPKPLLVALFGSAVLAIVTLGVLSYQSGDRPTRNNQTHLERILCHLNQDQC